MPIAFTKKQSAFLFFPAQFSVQLQLSAARSFMDGSIQTTGSLFLLTKGRHSILSSELERNAELMANVSQLYEELISYADLYDSASFEAKKMIVSQLIRRVDVYRGYQIHVDFNFDLAQYLENSDELAC